MAKASFYINYITVRKEEGCLILEARKQCQHGMVFDEVYLTLPEELASLFNCIDPPAGPENGKAPDSLLKHYKRFTTEN